VRHMQRAVTGAWYASRPIRSHEGLHGGEYAATLRCVRHGETGESRVRMSRGFKIVTPENWVDPDPLSGSIVKRDHRDGSIHAVDGRDWIAYVNEVPLSVNVPQKVRDAYDFAVGAVGHGYFYYPIFTLVVQQLLRAADFAVAHLFVIAPTLPKPKRMTFEARLEVLKDSGQLDDRQFTVWSAFRWLRNSSTHRMAANLGSCCA
jgi:hypothetical protein